jgi:hypothetical protein
MMPEDNAVHVDSSTWTLIDLNDSPSGARVRGPNWCVKEDYGVSRRIGYGFTPYDAYFNAFIKVGYTKYMAHELAKERLGYKELI